MTSHRIQPQNIARGTITYSVKNSSKFISGVNQMMSIFDLLGMKQFKPRTAKRLTDAIKPVEHELKIQGSKSKFRIVPPIEENESTRINMNRRVAQLVGTIYLNEEDKSILQHRDLYGEDYFIKYATGDYQWDITEEHKMIFGHRCVKATCKRIISPKPEDPIVAWFSETISNSIGPEGYGGLPGLIMELTTGKLTTYVISDICIEDACIHDIEIPVPLKTYDIPGFRIAFKEVQDKIEDMRSPDF